MQSVQAREGYRVYVDWGDNDPEEVDFCDLAAAQDLFERFSANKQVKQIRLARVIEVDLMSAARA